MSPTARITNVLLQCPHIRKYLIEHDPKALALLQEGLDTETTLAKKMDIKNYFTPTFCAIRLVLLETTLPLYLGKKDPFSLQQMKNAIKEQSGGKFSNFDGEPLPELISNPITSDQLMFTDGPMEKKEIAMPFHIVIRFDLEYYNIVAVNPTNFEEWSLFTSRNWDKVKTQRDQFIRLFGVDNIPLEQ